MNRRRILTSAVAVMLVTSMLAFAGCSKKKNDTAKNDTPAVSDGQNIEENFEGNGEDTKEEVKPDDTEKKPEFINPLTGLETTKELSTNRPLAVMINNIHQAMPQMGISNADIVYEILEEGGITRLMCVFQDYASLPELGSIRSARDYFIDVADAHDAMFVHCGGSTYAKNVIAQRKTEDIDAMYLGNFYRSKERAKTMAFEHTLMITGEGLAKNVAEKGYRKTTDASKQPLKFNESDTDIKGSSASHIKVPFSLALSATPYALSTLEYDSDSKVYLKGQYDTTHIDGGNGKQLSFKNVVVLECEQHVIAGDPLHCLAVDFTGFGNGFYATNGVIKPIKWAKSSRTSSYTLLEEDGSTELKLNPGKSYIAIVPTGTTVDAK